MKFSYARSTWATASVLLLLVLGTTYRTIVIDGTNDFASDETFSGTSSSTWYCTWDANNLYLGAANTDIGTSFVVADRWVLWYLDTDPQSVSTSGSGTTVGVTYNTQQPALPFTANYHLRWRTDDTYIDLQTFNGSAWQSADQTGITHSRVGSYLEIKIPRTNLGSPERIYSCAAMINEKAGAEWTYYLWPALHTDGYDVNFTHFYGFTLDAGRTPNDPANLDAPLPVQLTNFSASVRPAGGVRLEWVTVSEVNNYGFEVQRSYAGAGTFQTLPNSFTGGHGTTLQKQEYSFTDTTAAPGILFYRLKQIDLDGTLHFSEARRVSTVATVSGGACPARFSLDQNYPNPFNPSTTIGYELPRRSAVQLSVYNTLGQKMRTLAEGVREAGHHEVMFDATGLSSGVYLCRLRAGEYTATRKLLLAK